MSRETDLAWAAGFFDGEGWTGHTKGRSLACSISQSGSPALLLRFQAAVEGIGRLNNDKKTQAHHKEKWRWSAHGISDVQRLLSLLWPYLGEEKKRQAQFAIKEWLEMGPERRRGSRKNRIPEVPA